MILERFVAVLLHEIAHAKSGANDATRAFETELTNMLGTIGIKAIESTPKSKKGFWPQYSIDIYLTFRITKIK